MALRLLSGYTIDDSPFTNTERKLLVVLGDGREHSRDDLSKCLGNGKERQSLDDHLTRMRGKLRPLDLDILHKLYGRNYNYVLAKRLVVTTGE